MTRRQGTPTFPPAPTPKLGTPAFPTAPTQARSTHTFPPAPTLTQVQRTWKTMAGVAATAPNPIISGLPGVFTLLEDGSNMNPQSQLKRLVTLQLGERPPLVVCLDAPEPQTRMLWGTQLLTLSFAQPILEEGKILSFARDILLGLLTVTVVVHP